MRGTTCPSSEAESIERAAQIKIAQAFIKGAFRDYTKDELDAKLREIRIDKLNRLRLLEEKIQTVTRDINHLVERQSFFCPQMSHHCKKIQDCYESHCPHYHPNRLTEDDDDRR